MGLKRTDELRQDAVLSLGSYGRPRMTEELKEIGLDIGHRRPSRQTAVQSPAEQ